MEDDSKDGEITLFNPSVAIGGGSGYGEVNYFINTPPQVIIGMQNVKYGKLMFGQVDVLELQETARTLQTKLDSMKHIPRDLCFIYMDKLMREKPRWLTFGYDELGIILDYLFEKPLTNFLCGRTFV